MAKSFDTFAGFTAVSTVRDICKCKPIYNIPIPASAPEGYF
jgi:hypothetical protein